MAFTYGTVTKCKVRNGQTRNEYECRIGYQVNSQDIATNTSNVTLRLECRSINSSYATYNLNKGLTSVIDGTTIKDDQPVDMRKTNEWQNFGEKTITIYHNPDGTYSESKTGSFTCTAGTSQYSLQSGSASVTVAPATIPRYANLTQHYISRVSTSSITVYWNADASCDGLQCSLNGGGWFDVGGYPEYTLTGLAANTTYSIRTRIKRADSQLWTESETIWGTTYPIIYPTLSLKYKTVNSIEVNAGANIEASSIQYRIRHINGGFGEWQYSNVFGGLSPNNTYVIEVYMVSKQSGEGGSASITETTYDISTITSAPNVTIGENPTIQVNNPSGQQLWIYTENIINGSAESLFSNHENITGKTTHTINIDPNLMYSKIPAATRGIIRYVIQTVCNGETYYHWVDREYFINEAINKPIFNNFLYEDTNPKTVALTGNNKIFVKDYSNLAVIIPYANRAIAQNYASMLSYRLNVGNMTSISTDYNKENAEVRMYLDAINSPSITVTAIDSRQFSTPASYMLDFRAYEEPIIKGLAATRRDGGVSDQVDLSFNGTWWNDNFGAVHNSIKSIEYYYKATTSSEWIKGNTVLTPNIDGNYFNGTIEQIEGPKADTKGFDISTAYNIKLIVIDELQTSAEYQTILGTGTPALAICNNKVAIGSRYNEQLGGALQVKGEIIEEGLRVSKEEPSTKEKLWIKSGKNEFNINNLNVFMGGYANYTIKDKSIILTSVNYWARIDLLVRLEPNQQYTLSVDITNNETNQEYRATNISIFSKDYSFRYIEAYMNEAEGKIILTFTPFEEEVFILLYSNPTGQVLNNTVTFSNLQIEKGPVATEYEEFINSDIYVKNDNSYTKLIKENDVAMGMLQPAVENVWIKKSKNLFNKNKDLSFFVGVYGISLSSFIDATMLGKLVTLSNRDVMESITFGDQEGVGTILHSGNSRSLTFLVTQELLNIANSKYLWLHRLDGGWISVGSEQLQQDIQLQYGPVATEYEEYVETTMYLKSAGGVYEEFYKAPEIVITDMGTAEKYADGRLVQYGNYSIGASQVNTGTYFNVVLPVPFINDKYSVSVDKTSGGSGGFAGVADAFVKDTNIIYFTHWNFLGNAEPISYCWFAIGRWK